MRTGTTVSSIRRSVASRRLVELSFHAIRLAFVYPCVYVHLCVSEYPLVYSSYTFSAQLLYYSLLRIGITRRAAISFLATIRMHHLRDILRRYRLATCPSAYFLLSPSPAPRTPTPSSAILPFLRPLSDNYRDLFRNRISLFPSGLGLFAVRQVPSPTRLRFRCSARKRGIRFGSQGPIRRRDRIANRPRRNEP